MSNEKAYVLTLKGVIKVALLEANIKNETLPDTILEYIKNYATKRADELGGGFPAIIFLPNDNAGSFNVVSSNLEEVQ
jgi:hypothetical protein